MEFLYGLEVESYLMHILLIANKYEMNNSLNNTMRFLSHSLSLSVEPKTRKINSLKTKYSKMNIHSAFHYQLVHAVWNWTVWKIFSSGLNEKDMIVSHSKTQF